MGCAIAPLVRTTARPATAPSSATDRRRRRRRWSSVRIAQYYGFPLSTVVAIQRRLGLNRLSRLEPPRPVVRYEHSRPGALLHLDVKKLGRIGRIGHRIHGDYQRRRRGVGWEFVHVAIDDCTRLGYVEVLPAEDGPTTAGFLARTLTWFRSCGVRVRALLTDNAKCYTSADVQQVIGLHRLRHWRTRPYAHKLTARPSASSVRSCTSGHTARPIAHQHSALPPYRTTFASTTPNVVTPH